MESRKPTKELFQYIDIESIDNKSCRINKTKLIEKENAPSRASRAVFNGSVLFSMVRPYLKNIAYIDKEHEDAIASTGFYVCTSNGTLYPKFMYYLMISDYVVFGLNQFMKGDNSPSINKDNIDNWLFPIPPYDEQIFIVNRINSMISYTTDIEKSLS